MVHHVEFCHREEHARIPRQDRERLDDQVSKHRWQTEDGNLGVSLQTHERALVSPLLSVHIKTSRPTDFVEHPRLWPSIALPPCILESLPPSSYTLELLCHVPRRLALLVLDVEIRPGLDEPSDADGVALDDRPVERREARVVACEGRGRLMEEQVERDGVALIGGPHKGGVAVRVLGVDCDRLMEDVEQRHHLQKYG